MMNETVTNLPNKRRSRRTLWVLAAAAMGVIAWRYAHRDPEMVLVMPAPPSHNAFPYFVRAAKLADTVKHSALNGVGDFTPKTASFANFRACAKDMETALAVLRPALNRPFGYVRNPPFNNDLDISALFHAMQQAIGSTTQYYYMNGEYNRAATVWLDGAEAEAMMEHQGSLDDAFLSWLDMDKGLSAFEPALSHLSAPQLALVAARLDRIKAKQVSYADALGVEKILALHMKQEELKGWHAFSPKSVSTILIAIVMPFNGHFSLQELSIRVVDACSDGNTILWNIARYYDALIEEAKHPWTGGSTVAEPHYPLESNTGVDASASWVSSASNFAILRTETALYRYRAEHGKFPVTLDALVPAYLPVVPDDPCSGNTRKLTYRLQVAKPGFLLYSIGLNRKDDGGLPAPWIKLAGDIVAGHIFRHKPLPAFSYKDGRVPKDW